MTGVAFITSGNEWACSNIAHHDMLSEIGRSADGQRVSKRYYELKLISIFGRAVPNSEVECIFKPDEGKGVILGFKGRVRAVVSGTVYINVLHTIDNTKEIYQKIKGGIKNG